MRDDEHIVTLTWLETEMEASSARGALEAIGIHAQQALFRLKSDTPLAFHSAAGGGMSAAQIVEGCRFGAPC